MSVKVMGAVFEMNLPPSEKVVALALADHAHDDGTEARPGLERLAIKTSLSKRQVQRVLKELLAKGVLSVQRPALGTLPACYRFVIARGDNLSSDAGDALGVTSRAPRGDTDVTQTKEPSVKRHSPSDAFTTDFDALWATYPKKVDKGPARAKYVALRRKGVPHADIVAALGNYVRSKTGDETKYLKNLATFLAPETWNGYLSDSTDCPPDAPDSRAEAIRVEQARREAEDAQARAGRVPMPDSLRSLRRRKSA